MTDTLEFIEPEFSLPTSLSKGPGVNFDIDVNDAVKSLIKAVDGHNNVLCIIQNGTEYDIELDWVVEHGDFKEMVGDTLVRAVTPNEENPPNATISIPGFNAVGRGCLLALIFRMRHIDTGHYERFALLVCTPLTSKDYVSFCKEIPDDMSKSEIFKKLNAISQKVTSADGVMHQDLSAEGYEMAAYITAGGWTRAVRCHVCFREK